MILMVETVVVAATTVIVVVVATAVMTTVTAVGYSSPAENRIMQDLGLSVPATMWFSEVFCTDGWLSIAYAKNALWLDIGRLSIGIGAEITPKSLRGSFTSSNMLMITCGVALMFYIGTFISWRSLAMISAIPCVVQLIGLFSIPESPRWLEIWNAYFLMMCAYILLYGYLETREQHTEASFSRDSFCFKEHPNLKALTPFLALPGILIFPINVKAQAGSLVTLVHWSAAWITTYSFNFMMDWSSTGHPPFLLQQTVAFVAKLVPETKGRTPEDIQASITHFM
ncbi:Pentatricopeptide repeat (PPR) superfamily protein [Hibiscus syriacus]|uniref:Pentatricopeptide repeat (PPR) superfamily protein n=1 Tax=Hibiscus syriacus TaxID=106335 RepID=A0A6A2XHS1_HIBSY|nr:Pentatricopeptide repeat (PPR) superfamily protein [Hibiscus syriacus]